MALDVTLTPFPADFEVWEVHFKEHLNDTFTLKVRGGSTASAVDLRAFMGSRVTLSLPKEPRLSMVNGIVAAARRGTSVEDGMTEYEITIVPPEWLLRKRTDSRIFQAKHALEIANEVLGSYPQIAAAHSALSSLPEVREYCVQYDETDHDFVSRLLAEEGYTSFFDHAAGGRWTIVGDTTVNLTPDEDHVSVVVNSSNLKPGQSAVLGWSVHESLEVSHAVRRDHDFERPDFVLHAEHAARTPRRGEQALSHYAYAPGRFEGDEDGKREARHFVESQQAKSHLVHLTTSFPAGAGAVISIDGDGLSGEWLVVAAEVRLTSNQDNKVARHIELTVIERAIPWRPAARKQPRIFGTQRARVVGDTVPGTVDVDVYGRVKVEFRWDRRDLWDTGAPGKGNPTRRVRVAQAWAGPNYGFVTLPRIGDEVLVAYEEGNPDLPMVVGRMHNAVSITPLQLPETHKTLSLWKSQSFGPNGPEEGNNLIQMDDKAGAEELRMEAHRNHVVSVGHDAVRMVARHDLYDVGGDHVLRVGGSQVVQIGKAAPVKGPRGGPGAGSGGNGGVAGGAGDQFVSVAGAYYFDAREISWDAAETITMHCTDTMSFATDGVRIDSSENHTILANSAVRIMAKEIELTAGGSSIVLLDGMIKISSTGPVEINGSPVKLNCD